MPRASSRTSHTCDALPTRLPRASNASAASLARHVERMAFCDALRHLRRIHCTEKGSMREWEAAAQRRDTGDWRSGSAGPLQGQGRGFKSLIAHQRKARAGSCKRSGPFLSPSQHPNEKRANRGRRRATVRNPTRFVPMPAFVRNRQNRKRKRRFRRPRPVAKDRERPEPPLDRIACRPTPF